MEYWGREDLMHTIFSTEIDKKETNVKGENMDDINLKIYSYLSYIGVKHSSVGYNYLRKAILIFLHDPNSIKNIIDVYRIIGEEYGTNSSSVERGIRYASRHLGLSNKELVLKAFHMIQYDAMFNQYDVV